VASKVNELQSQLTILSMATSHTIDNGVPKHNQALEAQGVENQALRKQIMALRRELVKSTSTILEANDDFTNQVQSMSDRTMLLERKAEQKVNELHDAVETCRDVMDNVKEDISETKSRAQECAAEIQALLNYSHRTSDKINELQDGYNRHAQAIHALQNRVAALAPASNIQASPFATIAATAMTNAQAFPTARPVFGCYGFGSQNGQYNGFNF
jgi:chromosome segregation ATPase